MAFKLQCNIDQRGRNYRMMMGLVLLVLGAGLAAVWALPAGGWLPWTVSSLAFAGGAFAMFEAGVGWCAGRAMGFKTPW